MSIVNSDYDLIPFKTGTGTIEIYSSPNSFRPNRVSESFARAIPADLTGLVVDDIGSGSGILALIEAERGAREVRAIEPAPANFELLIDNILRNNCQEKIRAYRGKFFDPVK